SGQFVSAGDARDPQEGAGLLAFKRELRELEARALALGAAAEIEGSAAREARTRLVGLEDAVVYLNEAIGREEREAMQQQHTVSALQQEVESAQVPLPLAGQ